MRIAIVGCGYVADHYLHSLSNHPGLELTGVHDRREERMAAVARRFDVPTYPTLAAVLDDPTVDLVVNLTDPASHFDVTRTSLLAGRHVYSEKPLALDFARARELVDLAGARGLVLSAAPCTVLNDTAQTLWRAVSDGAVGRPVVVYAELDDNPVYLMRPEGWRNETGAPWPYLNEYEVGCTLEHAGYYLTWLAAMFGPASTVTAFSACLVPDKTPIPLDPPDTPDFSVACIVFESGVVARLTCSIVAPYDHRMKIVGDEGVLSIDECWNTAAPVHLERFSQLTLNARKSRSVRTGRLLSAAFGVGGRKLPFAGESAQRRVGQLRTLVGGERPTARRVVRTLSRRELISIDFALGIAAVADSIESGVPLLADAAFVLHVNELALAIQNARASGGTHALTTTFEPRAHSGRPAPPATYVPRARWLSGAVDRLVARLHEH